MNEVKDKVWFLREGLFAKYVVALVGLVVFVLAVNGAMEIWISYRGIKTSLTDAHVGEGGGDRQAHRAIDVRPGAADQLGDPRLLRHAPSSAAPTTRNCCGRCRRSASSRCSTPRAANSSA